MGLCIFSLPFQFDIIDELDNEGNLKETYLTIREKEKVKKKMKKEKRMKMKKEKKMKMKKKMKKEVYHLNMKNIITKK